MAIHRNQIREKAAEYRIESMLDPDRNVIFSAERPDFVDGEHLDDVLNSVEARLRKLGKSDRAIDAVRNIILELACNALMHGRGRGPGRNCLSSAYMTRLFRCGCLARGARARSIG